MALLREEEETEIFIEEYINQIKYMSKLSDLQIKIVLRQLMIEDPEWAEILKKRFRGKQLKKTKELLKDVCSDTKESIKNLARKVA